MNGVVPEQHPLRELALFAGAGGGILGGKLLGWRTVCAVEIEPYCREVLMRRQNEGHLEPFPIWDDVRTFDGRPWNGLVDVISGGFPCQDISVAGKGAGLEGERSGLWKEFARIISEVRPSFAFVENSPQLIRRGIGVVLGDLAALGYDARWGVIAASDLGARHERQRLWIYASDTLCKRLQGRERWSVPGFFALDNLAAPQLFPQRKNELPEPALLGSGHGMAYFVERSRAIGNGQVPIVAATAWRILSS